MVMEEGRVDNLSGGRARESKAPEPIRVTRVTPPNELQKETSRSTFRLIS